MEIETFGRRLHEARTLRGLSRRDLCRMAGVTRSTIEKWEQGSVYPNLYTLVAVADVLHVSIDWLAGRGYVR